MHVKQVRILMFVLMLSVFSSGIPAGGQELTKQDKIERILALTNSEAMMDKLFDQFKFMTAFQMLSGTTPDRRAKLQASQAKILDLLKARMGSDQMHPQYVKVYNETFSDEEINGLLAFLESPAGRAMVVKMPMIMTKMIAVSQAQMSDLIPEILRIAKEAEQ